MKHTPEPWRIYFGGFSNESRTRIMEPEMDDYDRWFNEEADKARIIRCINACANIGDAELDEMAAFNADARKAKT